MFIFRNSLLVLLNNGIIPFRFIVQFNENKIISIYLVECVFQFDILHFKVQKLLILFGALRWNNLCSSLINILNNFFLNNLIYIHRFLFNLFYDLLNILNYLNRLLNNLFLNDFLHYFFHYLFNNLNWLLDDNFFNCLNRLFDNLLCYFLNDDFNWFLYYLVNKLLYYFFNLNNSLWTWNLNLFDDLLFDNNWDFNIFHILNCWVNCNICNISGSVR